MCNRLLVILILCFSSITGAWAQTVRPDTLKAAVKTEDRFIPNASVKYPIDMSKVQRLPSPTGEGDVIKFIQTLPGVSTGAEGSSAMYARGGNMGNNLMTLDGVPVYGISHILGFTTVFSPETISTADFQIGGFTSEDGNLTASHIKLSSKDGSFDKASANATISNFLIGASVSTPVIKDRLSFIGAARISPIGLEYRALRNLINKYQDSYTDFGGFAYDVFGKLKYKINPGTDLSLSVFNTLDRYSFKRKSLADERMETHNLIFNLQLDTRRDEDLQWHFDLSYNNSSNTQSQENTIEGVYNLLQIRNNLKEVSLSGLGVKYFSEGNKLQFGVKARGAFFKPGTARKYDGSSRSAAELIEMSDKTTPTVLATAHTQMEWCTPARYDIRLSARLNAFISNPSASPQLMLDPEFSFLARYNFIPQFGVEVTGDYLTQYYHTLEGIPMGWSVDLVVPSDKTNKPEQALQGYAGVFSDVSNHHFGLGGYYKYMKNLVYFKDAKKFFSADRAHWHDNIERGSGTSYGVEFIYEKVGKILNYKIAYTWSKSDRLFKTMNHGNAFPAKFDRRHILNASASWIFLERRGLDLGLNTFFTYQSGHWETTQDGSLPGYLPGTDEPIYLPLVPAVNNFHMPDFIRWDNSVELNIKHSKAEHTLRLGVYNTLNRHNPFVIYYNSDKLLWETISLFPVMPSLYYRISF